jgi:hypothetical protein
MNRLKTVHTLYVLAGVIMTGLTARQLVMDDALLTTTLICSLCVGVAAYALIRWADAGRR